METTQDSSNLDRMSQTIAANRDKMQQALRSGLMEPLLSYLERQQQEAAAPQRPRGPEYPFSRAFDDGRASAFADVLSHILNYQVTSADGP